MAGILKQKKRIITKRGRGKKTEKLLSIFSTNAAGLKNKVQSFRNELKHLNCGIFTIQETHFRKKGTLKIDGFDIFESIRNKQKGGTMIGVHKALNPVLIEQYEGDFELLVVDSTLFISICDCYSPAVPAMLLESLLPSCIPSYAPVVSSTIM